MLLEPFKHILVVLTIMISFFGVGLSYLCFSQFKDLINHQKDAQWIYVYLQTPLGDSQLQGFQAEHCGEPWVKLCQYVDQAQAKEKFLNQYPDFKGALEILDENPLPVSMDIQLQALVEDKAAFALWLQGLQTNPKVTRVDDGGTRLARFIDMMRFIDGIVWAALMFMGVMIFGLVYNTISLLMISKKDHIAIMRLAGATPRMLRLPIVLNGACYGLAGVGVALGLLFFLFTKFNVYMDQYFPDVLIHRLRFLHVSEQIWMMLFGIVVSVLGAWLAVSRYLYKHPIQ